MRACPAGLPGARPDPACCRKCAHWLRARPAPAHPPGPARRARNALLGADGVKFPGIALLQSGLIVLACLALGKLILEFLFFFFGKQLRPEAALFFLRRPLSPSVGSSITAVAKKSRKRSSTSPNRLFPVTGAAAPVPAQAGSRAGAPPPAPRSARLHPRHCAAYFPPRGVPLP